MEFLLIVGSTREGRKTIHAAEAVKREFEDSGHNAELYDLKDKEIPFLGTRTYSDEGEPPEEIQRLSDKVEETDCVVIISPEYNHSIPGVLKNALDYLYPEYHGKPFAYITTSAGGFGGVRGLSHLHDFTLAVKGHPGPNLPISNIHNVFSEEGEIEENEYHDRIQDFLQDTVEHVEDCGE